MAKKRQKNFVFLIKEEINNTFDSKKEVLATKADLAALEIKMARMETKLILWAFVFWATQLGAVFAFLKFFMK